EKIESLFGRAQWNVAAERREEDAYAVRRVRVSDLFVAHGVDIDPVLDRIVIRMIVRLRNRPVVAHGYRNGVPDLRWITRRLPMRARRREDRVRIRERSAGRRSGSRQAGPCER